MLIRSFVLAALLGTFSLAACGGGGGAAPPPTTPTATPETTATSSAAPTASAAPATPGKSLDEQVAAGEKVYAEKCAGCHGAKAEGQKKAPALIGPKALDDYHNGKEAYKYIKDMMPPTSPGSLTDDEYWNVTAYLIKKNNLKIDAALTPATAESVKWSR